MREFTTYAIVLKKETVNEADGKVIFYSELMGKIEIVAKGLKKILAKFNSHLEPLNLVEITFIESTNKHLTSVWTMNNFSNIRHNYIALENTLKMLNFFNEAIIGSEKDNLLWQSLNFYLKNIGNVKKNSINLFYECKEKGVLITPGVLFYKNAKEGENFFKASGWINKNEYSDEITWICTKTESF